MREKGQRLPLYKTHSFNAIVGLVIVVFSVKFKAANSILAKDHDDHRLSSAGYIWLVLLRHILGRDLQNFNYQIYSAYRWLSISVMRNTTSSTEPVLRALYASIATYRIAGAVTVNSCAVPSLSLSLIHI